MTINRDDIIRMAREAGLCTWTVPPQEAVERFERFAALVAAAERNRAVGIAKGMQEKLQAKFEQNYMVGVIAGAAAEREACANLCETSAALIWEFHPEQVKTVGESVCINLAAAIRARGQA